MKNVSDKQLSNEQRIDILCQWIEENLDKRISWADLSRVSGLDDLALRLTFLSIDLCRL
jgi:hypothetical protein